MAIFDPAEQRICLRIVYDGVAGVGKTQNLRMLGHLLTTQRASGIRSPGEAAGRTPYFDWLQISAGFVCGLPVTCQVLGVPGLPVLMPRRRRLLALADAVVFVTDAAAPLDQSREGLSSVEPILRGRAIPFLVQANKQDLAGACDGPSVATRLGRPEVEVVEAAAARGAGVVDTFLHAVRLVSRTLQAHDERGTLRLPVARASTPADLLAQLRREPLDTAWAAETVLEDAAAELRRTTTPRHAA